MGSRGRIWQASRTCGGAMMLASVMASALAGGIRSASPLSTPTRQVEQRARPPHTEACGTSLMRLISSSVGPSGTRTIGPPR